MPGYNLLCRLLDHVVTVPSRDGDESDSLGVIADLLDEVGGFLDDFLESLLRPLGSVHLVDSNDELSDTEGEGEERMLTSLALLGDTSLELTLTTGNDENSTISLGGTGDHVFDEVTMARGVNDLYNEIESVGVIIVGTRVAGSKKIKTHSDHVLRSLELPESDIDCDTTFTFGLQLIEDPS
jgi:hypothetical protein